MAEKPEDLPARPRNGETGGFPGQPRSGETGENSNVAADDNVALEHQAIASLLARMLSETQDAARRRWPQCCRRTEPTPPDAA